MKKKIVYILAISLILLVVAISAGWLLWPKNTPTPASDNIKTLNQGTQMRYKDISIGLSSVDQGSGWISIKKDNEAEANKYQVVVGDMLGAYGYNIEIKSLKSSPNPTDKSGASNGYITFTIDGQ